MAKPQACDSFRSEENARVDDERAARVEPPSAVGAVREPPLLALPLQRGAHFFEASGIGLVNLRLRVQTDGEHLTLHAVVELLEDFHVDRIPPPSPLEH